MINWNMWYSYCFMILSFLSLSFIHSFMNQHTEFFQSVMYRVATWVNTRNRDTGLLEVGTKNYSFSVMKQGSDHNTNRWRFCIYIPVYWDAFLHLWLYTLQHYMFVRQFCRTALFSWFHIAKLFWITLLLHFHTCPIW